MKTYRLTFKSELSATAKEFVPAPKMLNWGSNCQYNKKSVMVLVWNPPAPLPYDVKFHDWNNIQRIWNCS